MRETMFYWCKQCEIPLEPDVEADLCPQCNSALLKGTLGLNMRKLALLAFGVSLVIQFPLVLANALVFLIGPMLYGIFTQIQIVLSALFFTFGVFIMAAVRLLKLYPVSLVFDTSEEVDNLQFDFREQIMYSSKFFALLIPMSFVVVSLLAVIIAQML